MEATRRRLLAKAKRKSLMITIVIVATFVICWTPYYAMMVIFIFNLDPDQRITGELSSAIFFFGSSTAMINPVIYGAFHLRRPSLRRRPHRTQTMTSHIIANSNLPPMDPQENACINNELKNNLSVQSVEPAHMSR